ncbi:MAG: Uma2 family endonuclease [Planctomycetes bacterium]|nr:Uma2 family endonuclease [Planctomycetota bacterium]
MKNIVFAEHLTFPDSVQDHETFRRWVTADDFPEKARVSFLDGDLWVDLPMERVAHNFCKKAITNVLSNLNAEEDRGLDFSDGMLLTNVDANLSTQPEFMFVASETLESGRVTLLHGDDSLEIIGSPDMTLEVVSPTSVEKDTVTLRRLYWEAGVKEYLLADCRENHFSFDILRRGPAKFVPTRKSQGWIKSVVFGLEFKLTRATTKRGVSKFTLEAR